MIFSFILPFTALFLISSIFSMFLFLMLKQSSKRKLLECCCSYENISWMWKYQYSPFFHHIDTKYLPMNLCLLQISDVDTSHLVLLVLLLWTKQKESDGKIWPNRDSLFFTRWAVGPAGSWLWKSHACLTSCFRVLFRFLIIFVWYWLKSGSYLIIGHTENREKRQLLKEMRQIPQGWAWVLLQMRLNWAFFL